MSNNRVDKVLSSVDDDQSCLGQIMIAHTGGVFISANFEGCSHILCLSGLVSLSYLKRGAFVCVTHEHVFTSGAAP